MYATVRHVAKIQKALIFRFLFVFFSSCFRGVGNTESANQGSSGPFPWRQIRKGKKEEELTEACGKGIGRKSAEKR